MKRLLPGKTEIAIFATLAILCAVIATRTQAIDLSLAMLSVPLFIACSILGMHRSGQFARPAAPVKAEASAE